MIKKDIYFIEVIPFRILEKDFKKTLIVSNKGCYKRVDSAPLLDFKEGDYLLKSTLIGEGFIRINYFKVDDKKIKENFQKKRLENLFFKFRGTPLFPFS